MHRLALCAGLALWVAAGFAQPYGIDTRQPNTELTITELPPPAPDPMQLVRVFPQLSFQKSVLLVAPPDASGRLFHVSQRGILSVFPNIADPAPGQVSTFLDIQGRVLDSGEQGLLGLAFDPDYATNGEFYVYYSASSGPRRSVVSRFTAPDPAGNSADPGSEEIILEVAQPYSNHNGGMIAFGAAPGDDNLYIGLGDGGSGGDPLGSGQDSTTLLGSILRIDVRSTEPGLNYAIPPDNPYATPGSGPDPDTRREIFAWGLRNPYRFSFDMNNYLLYAGDVGQNAWEEIDVVSSGDNLGWNIREGDNCYPPSVLNCPSAGLTPPIAEYSHAGNGGNASVTGGYVYYGADVPELYGVYVFGDYVSGRVYGLNYQGTAPVPITTLVETSGITPTGFGQDSSGEVYVLDFFGGVYVLRPQTGGGPTSFPNRLSDLPALFAAGRGQGHTVSGVIPYEPSAKLWSDGALKERYFALPDFDFSPPEWAQAGFQLAQGWDFPNNTAIVKNFLLPLDERTPSTSTKRIETRLLLKNDGQWYGFSYEWNDEETDAQLLTTGKQRPFTIVGTDGQPFAYSYQYPSRSQCLECHTQVANWVLGLTTAQLNYDFTYPTSGVTDNQLRTYDHIDLLDPPLPDLPSELPKMPDPADATASIEDRARAYLASNCAMCHQPGATAPTTIDLRWETPLDDMELIGAGPQSGDLGIAGARLVKPGFPQQSVLLARMESLADDVRMPPLATSRVDPLGTEVVREWILALATDVDPAVWRRYVEARDARASD